MLTADQLLSILDHITEGVYFVDSERRVLHWNRAAERISGYAAEAVVGRHCGNFLQHVDECGGQMCGEACPLLCVLASGRPQTAQAWLRHRAGQRVPVAVEAVPFTDPATGLAGVIEIFRDNSASLALMQRAQEMEQLAYIDPLTEIGNRRYAEQVLRQSWDDWSRNQSSFGVALMDLDHFKAINDLHGHDAGDHVLRVACRTLTSSLRSFDFLGRWGGEELLAIVQYVRPAELMKVTGRFVSLLRSAGYEWESQVIRVTASVGVAVAEECDSVEALVGLADERLYVAKCGGRDRVIGPETPSAGASTCRPDPQASRESLQLLS